VVARGVRCLFIIVEKARAREKEVKRCRCYERQRARHGHTEDVGLAQMTHIQAAQVVTISRIKHAKE
jgi:uroporphyrinogen-III synthase